MTTTQAAEVLARHADVTRRLGERDSVDAMLAEAADMGAAALKQQQPQPHQPLERIALALEAIAEELGKLTFTIGVRE